MKNNEHPDSDIASLLVLQWFSNNLDTERWSDTKHFKHASDLVDIARLLFSLLPYLPQWIEEAITHFQNQAILEQVSSPLDKHYVLMPRGIRLWRELNSSNILLHIYRDDLWLEDADYNLRNDSLRMSKDEQFQQGIKLCWHIAKTERRLTRSLCTSESVQMYFFHFGRKSIAKHIAEGILKSFPIVYQNEQPISLQNQYNGVYSYICETERMLDKNERAVF